jgi:hypothetical protein
MLNATVQKLGDTTILHFKGRIVIGDACLILRNAVLGQAHSRMLVLDLELTRLDRVFESCSVRDLFCLLRRAAAMPPWSVDESNPADAEANCNPSVLGQESVPAC